MNIDPKYRLYPVFLYLKAGIQRTILFELNGKTHLYGYHNGNSIDLIVTGETKLKDYKIARTSPLFEEFVKIRNSNPNLNYKDIIENTCINLRFLPKDVLNLIGKEFKNFGDLRNFCLTSKVFNQAMKGKYMQGLRKKYDNELIKLIRYFPDKNWNFYELCRNPNFNVESFIQLKIDTTWNLSQNPGITFTDIKTHPEIEWDWKFVSMNPNITLKIIEDFPNEKWDWWGVSQNPNLTINFIMKHRTKNWDWSSISSTIPITLDIINNNDIPWDYDNILYNKHTTMDIIEKYLPLPYTRVWNIISENENITMEFVLKYKNYLNMSLLSKNSAITFDNILLHPEIQWDNSSVSMNKNITPEIIESNPNFHWDYYRLRWNPNMTKDFIIKYIDKQYWYTFFDNPGVLPEEVINFSVTDFEHLNRLSNNPNLTAQFVKSHLEINWNWNQISENKFKLYNK